MRQRFATIPILLVLVLALALGAPAAARAANHNVSAGGAGLFYSPSTVTIQAGDTVTWSNAGGGHNVISDTNGLFRCANGCDGAGGNGEVSDADWHATVQFNTAGTFGYHCEAHGGRGTGMHGTVIVEGAPPPPDSPGTLRFTSLGSSVSEGVANATIKVSRVDGDDGAASVSWTAAAGTATAGADFTAAAGTLTWADHDDADKSFQVHIVNDSAQEGNETVLLTLSNATGAALDATRKNATLTILDNDSSSGGVPPAPTALTATATSRSEITLAWHDVTGETGYLIERKKLGGTAFQEIGSVTSNVTSFISGGLEEATAYTFRVRAQNAAGNSAYSNEATAATDALVAPCVASSTVLCLTNNRFAVHLTWRSASSSGDGHTVPLPAAPDSGLFYFEQSSNIEMLIKVLNACSFTPNYWVFFAATTNVELFVTVSDTQTGKTRVYFNPLNTAALPVQDTSAFNCP
jgi:plastocyanin